MANTRSAKKAARRTVRRTAINMARRSRMRTFVRNVELAIASGDKDAAVAAMKAAEPEIARAAQQGVVHRNAGARKVSRLSARIKSISVDSGA